MRNKISITKSIVILALVVVLATRPVVFAASNVPQGSRLSGTVVETISVGANVSEGQVLVKVKTVAGSAPAARANCSGKVVSVAVANGSSISAGQVVAQVAKP